MDERKDVEAWADALLAQHRTAPVDDASAADQAELPPLVRLSTGLSGEEPDPMMVERLRRHQARHSALQKIDAVVWMIAAVLACAFGYAWISMF